MNQSTKPSTEPVILVIDDNRDAATTLAILLQIKGYRTHACYSGQEALTAVDTLRPDFILLDLAMPGMDGFETARLLRQKPWQPRLLIALSGYSQAEDKHRAEEAGFDEYLVKPVDLPALTTLLSRSQAVSNDLGVA